MFRVWKAIQDPGICKYPVVARISVAKFRDTYGTVAKLPYPSGSVETRPSGFAAGSSLDP